MAKEVKTALTASAERPLEVDNVAIMAERHASKASNRPRMQYKRVEWRFGGLRSRADDDLERGIGSRLSRGQHSYYPIPWSREKER